MKKTILHVIPVFATGGAERLVLEYAKYLDKDHYDVHVASCVEDGELRGAFEEVLDIEVKCVSRSNAGGRIAAYRELFAYVKKIQPSIIHTHMISADLFGYLCKRLLKKKVVWISTMHNMETHSSVMRQWLWKKILPKADNVITVSKAVQAFTEETFNILPPKNTLLLNGIQTKKWLDVPVKKYKKNQPIQIASIGRLWEQKGHVYLFEALSLCDDVNYQLHLFGDGPLRDTLEQKAVDYGISDNVTFHGVVKDIPNALKDIDIVVQPSLWEGLSLVVMEVMSAGKPIIASMAAGEELILHNNTGYLVPTKSRQELANMLQSVVNNMKDAEQVALKARAYAKDHFTIETHIKGLETIYKKTVC